MTTGAMPTPIFWISSRFARTSSSVSIAWLICFYLTLLNSRRMPSPRAVLWDLDGTLIDSEQYHWLAWRDTMAAEGVALTHEQFLETFGMRNDAIVPQWIPGISSEGSERIADAKERLYRRLVREGGLVPLPGAAEWTERLAADGWLQAIASSAPRENIDAVLAVMASHPFFKRWFRPRMLRAANPTRRFF